MKKDVLCIIPARSGSKGIKNKNIKEFLNKPLIYYTIMFAKKLPFIKKIIFSTDSKQYLNIAKKYYKFEMKLRPDSISKDKSTAMDYIKYELKKIQNLKNFKYLLLLQPTSPFRKNNDFIKAYKLLKNNKCDTVITAKKVKEHPILVHRLQGKLIKFISKNHKESLKGRQNYETLFIRSGSMYFSKIKNVIKFNSILNGRIRQIEVNKKYALNLDENEDLIKAEYYFRKK